ncbi:Acetamidase/formamidase [Sulfobacillus thermosulfidooxidans DSM 9293]|uniref:Acetamidase/formamidase n=1 Tax=Sulfobacillus thermosulfidooxidans (strain DSM 9293 / VKM B-1269 / AT-1) TaxID=929705 RepID=A0A1W1W8B6_SULTA|nr:acetamidase/formamidase family protein [Sulfobacillus thermosulfidooxidans]SMC02442.1 Acetamidase/formamidase [Sulfobacillus thermosulfidooxidans DSM 9293]
MDYELRARPDTCHWGYFDNQLDPVLRVESGSVVRVECLSHRAGDAPDLMMNDTVLAVYESLNYDERGPGGHIVTGPIAVKGAMPGDTLECRLLGVEYPLPYGSNLAAKWGWLYTQGETPLKTSEYVTIYKIDGDAAIPVFQYPWPSGRNSRKGDLIFPEDVTRLPCTSYRVPLRPHLGICGVAPKMRGKVSTIPPGVFGGNVDNRHFMPGTAMYYPVQVPEAMVFMGDTHLAEGDGEVSGTAIEGHLTVLVQLALHRQWTVPGPVLETDEAWMVHGFGETLDKAMTDTLERSLRFLKSRGLDEAEGYALLSAGGDFQITQVVNSIKGIHAVIPKKLFNHDTKE